MKSKQIGSSKYFTFAEYKETVAGGDVQTFANEPRQMRDPFSFSTGSVYHGEWKGGFRDGKGTQTWADGASYTGEW